MSHSDSLNFNKDVTEQIYEAVVPVPMAMQITSDMVHYILEKEKQSLLGGTGRWAEKGIVYKSTPYVKEVKALSKEEIDVYGAAITLSAYFSGGPIPNLVELLNNMHEPNASSNSSSNNNSSDNQGSFSVSTFKSYRWELYKVATEELIAELQRRALVNNRGYSDEESVKYFEIAGGLGDITVPCGNGENFTLKDNGKPAKVVVFKEKGE